MDDSLIFFDKGGNGLNLNYNKSLERYEGGLLFQENSSDTFKTIGLYMFEKVSSFSFEKIDSNDEDELFLNKFQLFNEFGIYFIGNDYTEENIENIETVNNDEGFQSKWIYGIDFETKFPTGSEIKFNATIAEFTNVDRTYTVVGSRKGAVMIISDMDNKSFNSSYSGILLNSSTYINKTITGINAVEIHEYIDSSYDFNIADWSEPQFFQKLFKGQKLSIVNSKDNSGVVTIDNKSMVDNTYFTYSANESDLTGDLIAEYISKGDVPKLYKGTLNFESTNKTLMFGVGSGEVPIFITPGVEFKVPSSTLNNIFLTVGNIPLFNNTGLIDYNASERVMYNGKVYECISTYTQEVQSPISPLDLTYWKVSDTVPIVENITDEYLTNSEVFFTSNVVYFTYEYGINSNSKITMASFVEKHKEVFNNFNIDLKYEDGNIISNSKYSSKYNEVNFYNGGLSNDITSSEINYEKVIGVEENLITELNEDFSELNNNNILIKDLDEYGLRLTINGMIYYTDTIFSYIGNVVNLDKTIDRTLRHWISENYIKLVRLGVIPQLINIGNSSSIYINAINLSTVYPNVPLNFKVEVGSTASFHIEHTHITFYDMGNILNIFINGRSFIQEFDTNIAITLEKWVSNHNLFLYDIGAIVHSTNQVLYINTIQQDANINDIDINIGKSKEPGNPPFEIDKRFSGNEGVIITSNEVIHNNPSVNFEDEGFSSGMLTSINNSNWPLNNQEYNILYLDPDKITLSYQGPFWGNTMSYGINAFQTFAFDSGYGYDPNGNNISVPIAPTYSTSDINVIDNPVDIEYVQLSESLYVLGDDISVIDGGVGDVLTTIPLGVSSSLDLELNPINNLMYALSLNDIFMIDPTLNQVINTYTLPNSYDLGVNAINGDVYISQNLGVVVYDQNGVLITTISFDATNGKMAYNKYENCVYCTSPVNDQVIKIDGSNRSIVNTYTTVNIQNELYYNEINNSIYGFTTTMFKISSNVLSTFPTIETNTFHDLAYNAYNNMLYISTDKSNELYEVDSSENINTYPIGEYGFLTYGVLDDNMYISSKSSNEIMIFDVDNKVINNQVSLSGNSDVMSYNPIRNSVWSIIPSLDISIEVLTNVTATPSFITGGGLGHINIEDGMYGSLDSNFEEMDNLLLKTREFIRSPRENFETNEDIQVSYKWHWETDQKPNMFIYDFSGDYLDKTGPYKYTGMKPLPSGEIYLNRIPNGEVERVSEPTSQQTIFDEIIYELDYIDSTTNLSYVPEPMELFLGFNSPDEGVYNSKLILSKIEEIEFDINSNYSNGDEITFKSAENELTNEKWGELSLDINSTEVFTGKLLKSGQLLQLFIYDNTNSTNQRISFNNGKIFKIRNVYSRTITLDLIDSELVEEKSTIDDYPMLGDTSYFTTGFKVVPKEIGRFDVMGQTEVEDFRFRIELGNIGHSLNADDVFIFKDYDINEQGIDWKFLNKKRKEMMMIQPDIYDYIGSYKSIINAINLFGYNDLELYEYYRNINRKSPNFDKLFKVEIPDIFDNTTEGWEENDFIKGIMPNERYKETNLFNLTYRITDKEGNSVLTYSLDDVIIKLAGLKNWLETNVVPITHNILDITGRTDTVGSTSIEHENYDVTILNINNEMTPINFKIMESYLLPINSGSNVYNVALTPFAEGEDFPEYYNIDIRTYKTYKEWDTFETYSNGDNVSYFGKLYESAIDKNKMNNPKEYEDVPEWISGEEYVFGKVVVYNRKYYQYSIMGGNIPTDNTSPYNNADWLDVTEWKIVDIFPVQKISEYRYDKNLKDFNFTLDSSIDPFVIIKLVSDNGYGQTYTVKKSYEIRVNADSDTVLLVEEKL